MIAASSLSKAKMVRFFGDPSIPVQSGAGSRAKLQNMLVGSGSEQLLRRPRETVSLISDLSDASNEFQLQTGSLLLDSIDSASSSTLKMHFEGSIASSIQISTANHPQNIRSLTHQPNSDFHESDISSTTALGFSEPSIMGRIEAESTGDIDSILPPSIRHQINNFHEILVLSSSRTYLRHAGGSRKLSNLLGPEIQLDISIKEIKSCPGMHESLLLTLESRLPVLYFLAYLISEGGFEELLFYSEVATFQESVHPDVQAQILKSQQIFKDFLSPTQAKYRALVYLYGNDNEDMLDFSRKITRAIIVGIQNGSRLCFASIQPQVFLSLAYSFAKFKQSTLWMRMEHEIGLSHIAPVNRLNLSVQEMLLDAIIETKLTYLQAKPIKDGLKADVFAFIASRIGK